MRARTWPPLLPVTARMAEQYQNAPGGSAAQAGRTGAGHSASHHITMTGMTNATRASVTRERGI